MLWTDVTQGAMDWRLLMVLSDVWNFLPWKLEFIYLSPIHQTAAVKVIFLRHIDGLFA